jgi:hypothetical protein
MSCHKVPKNDPLSDCGKPNHSTISYYLSDDFEMIFYHLYTIYGNARLVLINAKLCVAIKVVGRDVRPKTAWQSTKWRPKNATTSAAGGFPTLDILVFILQRCKTTAGLGLVGGLFSAP